MKKENLKELQEKLKWLEETPWYIGKDGLPSILLILLTIVTGIVLGIIIILILRNIEKNRLREKIKQISSKK